MISNALVGLYGKDDPNLMLSIMTREHGERAVPGCTSEHFYLVDVPSCRCCGEWAAGDERCHRHRDRNPCAIEGCQRTTKAPRGRLADDGWMCAEHWRRHVPPHSKLRRAYHRFWRIAKKTGWTPELIRRFNRFWDGLVARARREASGGRIDVDEIHKLFGWD